MSCSCVLRRLLIIGNSMRCATFVAWIEINAGPPQLALVSVEDARTHLFWRGAV